jgi:hypothetical protein
LPKKDAASIRARAFRFKRPITDFRKITEHKVINFSKINLLKNKKNIHMKLLLYFPLLILLFSCNHKEQNEPKLRIQSKVPEITVKEEITLKNFTYEDIARYTMASIMGQPSKIIKVRKKDELYFVSYIRKSDHQKFDYKIKFDGNKILWANFDGRWRDSKYDEKITFVEKDNKLKIIQTFDDNSQDIQEYKIRD